MHKYISKPAILFFVLFSVAMYAQVTQKVCTGTTRAYEVKTPLGGNYSWSVTKNGNQENTAIITEISSTATSPGLASSSSVNINWQLTPAGTYKVKVTTNGSSPDLCTDSGLCDLSGVVTVIIGNGPPSANLLPTPTIVKTKSQNSICVDEPLVFNANAQLPPLPSGRSYTYRWMVSENRGAYKPLRYGKKNTPAGFYWGDLVNSRSFDLDNILNSSGYARSYSFMVSVLDPDNPCTESNPSNVTAEITVHDLPKGNISIIPICDKPGRYRAVVALEDATTYIKSSVWFDKSGGPISGGGSYHDAIPGDSPDIILNTGTEYKVSVTDSHGCIFSDPVARKPEEGPWKSPTVTIGKDDGELSAAGTLNICGGTSIKLKAKVGLIDIKPGKISENDYTYTYVWKKKIGNITTTLTTLPPQEVNIPSNLLQEVTESGTYTVEVRVKDSRSNSSSTTSNLNIYDCPPPGSPVTASITVNMSTPSPGNDPPDFSFKSPVTASTQPASPAPAIPPFKASFCPGGTVELEADDATTSTPGLTYKWKIVKSDTGEEITPTPPGKYTTTSSYEADVEGDYILTVTGKSDTARGITGCSSSKTIRVTKSGNGGTRPTVTIVSSATNLNPPDLCWKEIELSLNVTPSTGNYTYQWYRQIDYGGGNVTKNSVPSNLGGNNPTYTDKDSPTVNQTRTYSVVLGDSSGCTFETTLSTPRILSPKFGVTIESSKGTLNAAGSLPVCGEDSITLTAIATDPSCKNSEGNCTYQWLGLDTPRPTTLQADSRKTYQITKSGTYAVVVLQGANTCPVTSGLVKVTLNPLPPKPKIKILAGTAEITASPLQICSSTPPPPPDLVAEWIAPPPGSSSIGGYQWFKKVGDTPPSRLIGKTGSTIQPDNIVGTAEYTVTVTDSPNGCTSLPSSPVTVQVNPMPDSTIIKVPDSDTFCAGDSILLKTVNSSLPSGSYEWRKVAGNVSSVVSLTGSYTAADTGTYSVTITDRTYPTGCSTTSTPPVSLTKKELPVTNDIIPN